MPDFELLDVPEGTGHLLVMQARGRQALYTDTQGRGKVRAGVELSGEAARARRAFA